MKRHKKILSVVLALLMVLTLMPAGVFAEPAEYNNQTGKASVDINLTDITATRLNGNYVSLSFQSDTTGEYAYLITTKSGAPTEEEWNAANRVDMVAGENGLGKDNVTGAKCYLHLMAWDNDGNPMANPPAATEISANPISAGFDAIDEDGFANLPFSSAFSPGDDPTDIYQVETSLGNRYPVSARLMKLQLEAKETVLLECYDDVENGYPNYRIHVYTNEGPDYSLIDESDNDNGESAYGEATYFTAPSEGVYYIAIFCNDPDVVNGVDPRSATVKASKVATEDTPLTLK